ncbi:MAG: ATP-binding cassette domain-containing protein [Parachlamydiales bacterium]|jgi:zinc transport system ATP-binding protein
MPEAILFQGVDFAFENLTVLEKVNLKIKPGEFVGIVGPNGGGKTTFLKLACGLLKPTRGKILVFGKKPADFYPKISYVPQISKIERDFPISVLELVLLGTVTKNSFFYQYSPSVKTRALGLLETLGLGGYLDQPFGNLSGGQAQKALIAKALISNPEILILDEPMANLDLKGEKIIFQLIKTELQNKTVLMVSHDLNVVINEVQSLLFVEKTISRKLPHEICEHFAVGLYHQPLIKDNKKT